MFGLARTAVLAVSTAAGVAASQAPEMAQQYRQRLGGAMQELKQVVAEFDADAARHRLERGEALSIYDRSSEAFLRDRSQSVRRTLKRFEALETQYVRIGEAAPVLRPLIMLRDADGPVLKGALKEFEPALPLTLHGLIWAGAGLGLGYVFARLFGFVFRRRSNKVRISSPHG